MVIKGHLSEHGSEAICRYATPYLLSGRNYSGSSLKNDMSLDLGHPHSEKYGPRILNGLHANYSNWGP